MWTSFKCDANSDYVRERLYVRRILLRDEGENQETCGKS